MIINEIFLVHKFYSTIRVLANNFKFALNDCFEMVLLIHSIDLSGIYIWALTSLIFITKSLLLQFFEANDFVFFIIIWHNIHLIR